MASGSTAYAIQSYVKSLYNTGEQSDLTILCGDRRFKVHKWIFKATSPVLRQFVEGKFKEAQEQVNTVSLPDDDPDALDAFFHFLYNSSSKKSYKDSMITEGESTLCFAVKVYAIADKYEVKELQAQASRVIRQQFILQDNIDELLQAITLVDQVTNPKDPTLWKIIMPVIRENLQVLLESPAFLDFFFEMRDFATKFLRTICPESKSIAHQPMTGAAALAQLYHMNGGRTVGDI